MTKDERTAIREAARASAARDSGPLREELRSLGLDVGTIAQLYNRKYDYRHAIPLLAKWLPKIDNMLVRESIVRALATPKARPHGQVIVDEFWRAGGPAEDSLRWAAGNTLDVIAGPSISEHMIEITLDRSLGRSREMVVYGLRKLKDNESAKALLSVLDDPSVSGHAISALARRKIPVSQDIIDQFATDERAWVRKDAQKLVPST